jgi:hypothetical protein
MAENLINGQKRAMGALAELTRRVQGLVNVLPGAGAVTL